jgi:hypothetical protein
MATLKKLGLRLRALFFNPKMEDELQAELQFHLEREREENIARGMTPEEARLAALRNFGGVERVKEESRDVRGVRLLEEVWQDLRYGARGADVLWLIILRFWGQLFQQTANPLGEFFTSLAVILDRR